MKKMTGALISSLDEAKANIKKFWLTVESGSNPELIDKLPYFRAWYAMKDEEDDWIFAPSKVIGYKNLDPKKYNVALANKLDGRKTERVLNDFFEHASDPKVEDELTGELASYLAGFDKVPNSLSRIMVDPEALEKSLNNSREVAKAIKLILHNMPPEVKAEFDDMYF